VVFQNHAGQAPLTLVLSPLGRGNGITLFFRQLPPTGLSSYFSFSCIFAHVSRRVTMRLKTGLFPAGNIVIKPKKLGYGKKIVEKLILFAAKASVPVISKIMLIR
jgi:hypothetical protein